MKPLSSVGGPQAAAKSSNRSPAGVESATPPRPLESATTLGCVGSAAAVVDVVVGAAVVSVVLSSGREASPSLSSLEPPLHAAATSAKATRTTDSALRFITAHPFPSCGGRT